MKFNDTCRWLALLDNEKIEIWSPTSFFHSTITFPVDNGTSIAFDRTGSMIAIGTNTGISIIDLTTGKEISRHDVGEVTELYFSRDNRLLIWGEQTGEIHLWGVPETK